MVQDIRPHELHNQYCPRPPKPQDYIFAYHGGQIMLQRTQGLYDLPTLDAMQQANPALPDGLQYLFWVDEAALYLCLEQLSESEAFLLCNHMELRKLAPPWLVFAAGTALHLARWYDANRHCGRCARPMTHMEGERALSCPACGLVVYPKISPVVIVGITDGDRLLLTRYATAAYRRHALIAGFMEIGETPEDTVHREVMEEVGLRVKNLRYYKSQPWAYSESLLLGFFAELDGDSTVRLDETELSEGVWCSREDLPREGSTFSLTWDMIEHFRTGG